MVLAVKQKVFSLREKFQVMDADGAPVYEVKGKLISWGHKLTVSDMNGTPVAHIHQKVISLVPKYFIELEGGEEVELKGHITLLRPHYTLETPDGNWEVRGAFGEHEYTMTRGDATVATVAKKWFSWGDTYTLEVDDDRDALVALGVLIAIDCVMQDTTNARVATAAAAGGTAAHAASQKNDD